MNSIKYCPNCQKENDIQNKNCECGFEFFIKEVEDEVASTNTVVIADPVPEFVWKLIGIVCPIAGMILAFLWKDKWPERKKILFKVSLGMLIFIAVLIALVIFVAIGKSNGSIV